MEPEFQERPLLEAISDPTCYILPPTDLYPQAFHPDPKKPASKRIPFSRYLYECRSIMLSCSRSIFQAQRVDFRATRSKFIPACTPVILTDSMVGNHVYRSHHLAVERLEWQEIWGDSFSSERNGGCSALHVGIEAGREAVSDFLNYAS